MLVAGHSVHNAAPWIRPRMSALQRGKWLIRLYAQNEEFRYHRDIHHKQQCTLFDLIQVADKAAKEMLKKLDWEVTDAGFQVIKLR
jgi:hypothetical protein